MGTSIFLAKLMGLYFIIAGLFILIKHKSLRQMTYALVQDTPSMFVASFFAIIMGLLLVLNHNIWTGGWTIIITIFSWIVLLKGLFMLFMPQRIALKMVKSFTERQNWYVVYGIIVLILGLYMASKGFGIL